MVIHNVDLLDVFQDRRSSYSWRACCAARRRPRSSLAPWRTWAGDQPFSPIRPAWRTISSDPLVIGDGKSHCALSIVKSADPGDAPPWNPYRITKDGIAPCRPLRKSLCRGRPCPRQTLARLRDRSGDRLPSTDVSGPSNTGPLTEPARSDTPSVEGTETHRLRPVRKLVPDFRDGQKKEAFFPSISAGFRNASGAD